MDAGEAIEQFCAAIHNAGLSQPEVIEPDGKLHRFATNGRPKDDAGWYSFKVTSPSDPTGAAEQMPEIGREDAVAKWFHLRLSTRRNQRRSEP
jgi:hypothetical protein